MINCVLNIYNLDLIDDLFYDYLDILNISDTYFEYEIKDNIQEIIQEYKIKDLSYNLILEKVLLEIKNTILTIYPSIKDKDIIINEFGIYLNDVPLSDIADFNLFYFMNYILDNCDTELIKYVPQLDEILPDILSKTDIICQSKEKIRTTVLIELGKYATEYFKHKI